MKNIIIVATGGTIAGSGKVGKATNYQAGKINIKEIIDSIPMINVSLPYFSWFLWIASTVDRYASSQLMRTQPGSCPLGFVRLSGYMRRSG